MSDTVNLGEKIEPPQTVLTEMLVIFQDLFNKNKSFQLFEPVEVLAKILDEPRNVDAIRSFIAAYLNPHHPNPYQQAENGMAVMAILGYMFARGEKATKSRLAV